MAFPLKSMSGGPDPLTALFSQLKMPKAGADLSQLASADDAAAGAPIPGSFTDAQLLAMWDRWKKEAFDQRWVFERQWMRNFWYILNRQWIYFDARRGQWQDKRLAKWVPRPVTNLCKEAVQTVRANFAAIDYGTNARPLGDDPKNVIMADVADDLAPILHEDYKMDQVMSEFDFWLLVCGNAWLHTYVAKDIKYGQVNDAHQTCVGCQQETTDSAIAEAGQKCPTCGQDQFQPTMDQQGQPVVDKIPMPKGVCDALSPFEIAFPLSYERSDLAPFIVRMRWRDKTYYEQHEELKQYTVGNTALAFGKTPQDRTMQIFKTLPYQNDLGIAPPYMAAGGSQTESEGIVEYDVWVRPCLDFPEGQVIRFAGDANPTVIHCASENLPGPLPYTDANGNPTWNFYHGRYDEVGGRPLGSSLIDPVIQKQDQINQLDSHMLMVIGRMANPIWLEAKGAEVEKFTGEPGLVVKWNPMGVGGLQAKPERIPGESINQSVFAYRALLKEEFQELTGASDILQGQKPAGVEAFAALNLLLERGQARHATAFKNRGAAYKGWFGNALEIERQFGQDKRVQAVMMPSRAWAFKEFKKADLSGAVEIIIEDGTLTPKTSLGERAAIEHLRQLGLLNPDDPDQVMAVFEKFGQSRLLPGLDAQVQEAWMNMDRFEKFFGDPQQVQQAGATGQSPLVYRRWYNPQIHRQELIKWCLSDRGRAVFAQHPEGLMLVDAYLTTIDLAIAQASMGILDAQGVMINTNAPGNGAPTPGAPNHPGGPPAKPGGAGEAMNTSNTNAAGAKGSGAVAQQNPGQQAQQTASFERSMDTIAQHAGH